MHHQSTERSVTTLLSQYEDYKLLLHQQSQVARRLAKAKLRSDDVTSQQTQYDQLSAELQSLSDAMKFDSPTIWVLYKYNAYKNEAQPIVTMQDFRVHCSKPGYICTKRYTFVNTMLTYRGMANLTDETAYPGTTVLDEIASVFQLLEADEMFMELWREREYHTVDGRTAKWEND